MTKKPKPRKSEPFPSSKVAKPNLPKTNSQYSKPPVRWDLVVVFLVIALGGSYVAIFMRPGTGIPRFTYTILREFPHDPNAFTQGLVWENGVLWESTGRYGESSIRKVDLETGEVIKKVALDDSVFGEGLTLFNDELFQLTWKSGIAYVYDRNLNKIREHRYEGEGWGLTHDGKVLIMSDGTARLKFLNPKTFEEVGGITVREGKRRVSQLNELEYIEGNIYANQWGSDWIYEIAPETGAVTGIIDLTGLWPSRERPEEGLLNGIAINRESKKLLVTGKLCPRIFEVDLRPVE
jgi:glutamine cyclotransferase